MEATTELTQRGVARHGENLEQVKQDFTHWRKHHQRGTRIPTALWDAAVRMGFVELFDCLVGKECVCHHFGQPHLPSKYAVQI